VSGVHGAQATVGGAWLGETQSAAGIGKKLAAEGFYDISLFLIGDQSKIMEGVTTQAAAFTEGFSLGFRRVFVTGDHWSAYR